MHQKGIKFSLEARKRMSEGQKGRKTRPEVLEKIRKTRTGKPIHTDTSRKKIGLAAKIRNSGKNSHFWKGGITPDNSRIRTSAEYKLWRTAVFQRDNYTCVWCGFQGSKGPLNADHIKSFAHFPELRFAIDNGRTLCVPCHRTTNNFAYKARFV